jgi:hypothetical protein
MELENVILSMEPGSEDQKSHVLLHMQTLDGGQMQQRGWTWITGQEERTYGSYRNK